MTIDKSMVAYAIAAIAIIGVLFFITAKLGTQQRKSVQSNEDVSEAKLDAAVGGRVDPAPLSQPQKE
jgi:hypothetical protein